jgi:hypothetical protein
MESFEDVSVLKSYEKHTDAFIDYFMKSKVDSGLSISYYKDDDLYVLKLDNQKLTKQQFEEVLEKIQKVLNVEINEKTIHKIKGGDRFVRNYECVNGNYGFSSETIFKMFDLMIDNIFGKNLVSKTTEMEFNLILYKGDMPNDVIGFLSYLKLSS